MTQVRSHYEPGGLDQLVEYHVSCKRCRLGEVHFRPIRTALRVVKGEIVCPICRGPLAIHTIR